MHGGNIAFFSRNLQPYALAPIYDMLPMLYAPYQGNVPKKRFKPPSPTPQDVGVWNLACAMAEAFWRQVAEHPHISPGFRAIGRANTALVAEVAALASYLPSA
jgi:hypothetical protein